MYTPFLGMAPARSPEDLLYKYTIQFIHYTIK